MIETGAGRWMSSLPGTFTILLALVAVSCNEPSSERAPQTSSQEMIHSDLPADVRRGATDEANPSEPWEGTSGIAPHEHEPRHGGVVRSVDVYHVELANDPLQVWLYDRRGNRLPMDDLEGQVVVYSGDQRHPLTLQRRGDHLTPVEPFVLPDEGSAFVELTLGQQSIDVVYDLPLETSSTGDAG